MNLKLNKLQKTALSRILSDLIEADMIVDEGELDYFESTISEDGLKISRKMLTDARSLDYARAVEILSQLPGESRAAIAASLRRLSACDGAAVPLEAIQILAFSLAMNHGARIYSVPASDLAIDNMTVIFVESSDKSTVSSILSDAFIELQQQFCAAGFNFAMIPDVVKDFQGMSEHYLKRVVRYMLPSAGEEKVLAVCTQLRGMTTARFCRELICRRTGMPLYDAAPSLLVKINESDIFDHFGSDTVIRAKNANFLLLPLSDNPLAQIRALIDEYLEMVSCPISVSATDRSRKFVYSGFHRSLFDLIAYSKEQKDYILVFDFRSHQGQVYFEAPSSGERIPLRLTPQEMVLYYMIAKESLSGRGLDWREPEVIPKEELRAILDQYNDVYSRIGRGNNLGIYKDRTQTHHIRTRVAALSCVGNKDLFIPEHDKSDGGSLYRIRAPREVVRFLLD